MKGNREDWNGSRKLIEERLLDYAADCIRIAESLPSSYTGKHLSGQLVRSGTAPYAHQGEAQSAESIDDFIHKMSIALKELRESARWLRLAARVPLVKDLSKVNAALAESDELQRIFYSSIKTARLKSSRHRPSTP
jgi:four helix bundle protein